MKKGTDLNKVIDALVEPAFAKASCAEPPACRLIFTASFAPCRFILLSPAEGGLPPAAPDLDLAAPKGHRAQGLIVPLTLLALWETVVALGWVSAHLLPPPSELAADPDRPRARAACWRRILA